MLTKSDILAKISNLANLAQRIHDGLSQPYEGLQAEMNDLVWALNKLEHELEQEIHT